MVGIGAGGGGHAPLPWGGLGLYIYILIPYINTGSILHIMHCILYSVGCILLSLWTFCPQPLPPSAPPIVGSVPIGFGDGFSVFYFSKYFKVVLGVGGGRTKACHSA